METNEQKKIKDMASEDLGLLLGRLFEQGFNIQQDIHTITAELTRRQEQNKKGKKDDSI